jgi:hypothetical protein
VVLIVGIALSLFGLAIGGRLSVRIPATEANITVAASVGGKAFTRRAYPEYVARRLATSEDLVNATQTLTIGPAEATAALIVGKQEGAPAFDIGLSVAK